MVTVTDTYNATSMGAEQAILKDKRDRYTSWCTNNTSGTAKIMVTISYYFVLYLLLLVITAGDQLRVLNHRRKIIVEMTLLSTKAGIQIFYDTPYKTTI